MNRYMIICRLRWPAMLLLTGVIALLDQADILSWGHAWPLYLILFGVLALAERAVLAVDGPPPVRTPYAAGYPAGYAPQAGAYPGAVPPAPPAPPAASSLVQAHVPVYSNVEVSEPASGPVQRKSWDEEGR